MENFNKNINLIVTDEKEFRKCVTNFHKANDENKLVMVNHFKSIIDYAIPNNSELKNRYLGLVRLSYDYYVKKIKKEYSQEYQYIRGVNPNVTNNPNLLEVKKYINIISNNINEEDPENYFDLMDIKMELSCILKDYTEIAKCCQYFINNEKIVNDIVKKRGLEDKVANSMNIYSYLLCNGYGVKKDRHEGVIYNYYTFYNNNNFL